MAGPEATFYRWLASKFTHFEVDQWDRIESSTTKGLPDVDICHKGVCTKLEIKYEKGNQVHLRPEQRNWINKRIKAKGRVFIIVKRQTAKLDQIELYSGEQAAALFNKEDVTPIKVAKKVGLSYNGPMMCKIIQKIIYE